METGGVDINCFPYKIIISTLKIGCKFGFLRSIRRSPIRFLKFTSNLSHSSTVSHDCCISIATQQVPRSLNISSYLHNLCRNQGVKKTKIDQKMSFFSNFLTNYSLEERQQCKNFSMITFLTHLSQLSQEYVL